MSVSMSWWVTMLVLSVLPLYGHTSAAGSECPTASIGIHYEVTIRRTDSDHVEQFVLWRDGDSLLQERTGEALAELWERTRNGRVHLVRFFDADRRAIEYLPDDLGFRSDAPFRQRMALLNALCGSDEVAREMRTANDDTVVAVWRRVEITTDAEVVASAFRDRTGYLSTDYADIGDNETDPFLRRMINLGFVEHGSSGFYDAEGHAAGAEHAHR